MEKEKLNNQYEPSHYSFTMVPDYFYRKLIKVMGAMPSLIYLALLSYCHKKKYIAWPSLNTMSKEMGMAKTTIIRNLNILMKLKVIQNIVRDKSDKNYYHHNVYEILPPEKILLSLSEAKNNSGGGSVTLPPRFQNATDSGSEAIPQVVAERYPNHNNLNHNNITTKEGKDAVADFKKIKEKGEERMLAMKEQLRGLDFEESFIEKILKDFPAKKIEDKIDLLMEKRNIQNPAGWLMAALKSDYRDVWEERDDEEPAGGSGNLVNTPEQASRQKALAVIRLIQDNLSICMSPPPSGKYTGVRENVNQKLINERRCKCPKEENSSLKPNKKM